MKSTSNRRSFQNSTNRTDLRWKKQVECRNPGAWCCGRRVLFAMVCYKNDVKLPENFLKTSFKKCCPRVFILFPRLIRLTSPHWLNDNHCTDISPLPKESQTDRGVREYNASRICSSLRIGISTNHCAFLGQLAQWHKPKQPLVTVSMRMSLWYVEAEGQKSESGK